MRSLRRLPARGQGPEVMRSLHRLPAKGQGPEVDPWIYRSRAHSPNVPTPSFRVLPISNQDLDSDTKTCWGFARPLVQRCRPSCQTLPVQHGPSWSCRRWRSPSERSQSPVGFKTGHELEVDCTNL